MASWSPSQSEPLTVSYMCQRQSSSPMLPSAADLHVIGDRQDEQQHRNGDRRRTEDLHRGGMVAADQGYHEHDEEDRQRHAGQRSKALMPEMPGAGSGRAEAANVPERGAQAHAGTSFIARPLPRR